MELFQNPVENTMARHSITRRAYKLEKISNKRVGEKAMPMSKKIFQLTQTTTWVNKYRQFIRYYAEKDRHMAERVDPRDLFFDLQLLRDLKVNKEELVRHMSKLVSRSYKYTYSEMAPILLEILQAELHHLGPIKTIFNHVNKISNVNKAIVIF